MVVGSSRGFPWKTTSIRTVRSRILLFCSPAYKSNCHRKVDFFFFVFLLESCLSTFPSFPFCLIFCCVIALSVCVCKWKDTHSCSSSSRLLSALPCLTHFVCHWNRRRAFPACEGKTPLCSFCCHGKVDQATDSFSTATTFQFSYINNISDTPTITHLIQTALEAG